MLSHMPADFVEHATGLERHTGHGNKNMSAVLEPHNRRRAEAVHYHPARRWHPCLTAGEGIESKSSFGKDTFYICVTAGSSARVPPKISISTPLVISSRVGPSPPVDTTEIALAHRHLNGSAYIGSIVAYGAHTAATRQPISLKARAMRPELVSVTRPRRISSPMMMIDSFMIEYIIEPD